MLLKEVVEHLEESQPKKSVLFGLMLILTDEKTGKQLARLMKPNRRHVTAGKIAVYLFHGEQMRRRDESTAGGRTTRQRETHFPPLGMFTSPQAPSAYLGCLDGEHAARLDSVPEQLLFT